MITRVLVELFLVRCTSVWLNYVSSMEYVKYALKLSDHHTFQIQDIQVLTGISKWQIERWFLVKYLYDCKKTCVGLSSLLFFFLLFNSCIIWYERVYGCLLSSYRYYRINNRVRSLAFLNLVPRAEATVFIFGSFKSLARVREVTQKQPVIKPDATANCQLLWQQFLSRPLAWGR